MSASAVLASLQPLADNFAWLIPGTCLLFLISCFHLLRSTSDGKLYDVGGLPVLLAWSFYSKRYDFIWNNFHSSGGLPFRFRFLQHRVVALNGPNGRKVFFNHPSLNLTEGYQILMGSAPRIEDVDVPLPSENFKDILIKRVHIILRRERVADLLPILLDDLNRCMLNWGRECVIDPCKEINDIIFKMTLRVSTCDAICRDPEAVKTISKLYCDLERSQTTTALLFPWFPSPSRMLNLKTTRDIYNFILKFVQDRRAAGAPTKDPLDVLIQNGDTDADIVGMVMGIVFVGFIDTRIYSRWVVVYLGIHADWRQRAVSEIQSMISTHSDTAIGIEFHNQLASIPLSVWEDELPSLDLIIRESIRLSGLLTFLRRNVKADIDVDGVRIAKGDFLIYSATDVHMNENVYPDPEKFDPGRYADGRNEDMAEPLGYVGFGVGRHPCTGTRIAKLEMKILLAMLLLRYDYKLVDEHGNQINELPVPNRNDTFQSRPLGKPVYLKIKRIKE